MYKQSNYNVYVKDSEALYLLNTLYGTFVKFSSSDSKRVLGFFEDNSLILESELGRFLIKKHFFVPRDIDEKEAVNLLLEETLMNNNILNLVILPTENCNFRCSYCYESFCDNSMGDVDEENIIDFVERNIKYYKAVSVEWFGGEPLLHLDRIKRLSIELMRICSENRIPYSSGITTNGYLLDYRMVLELKKLKVCKFQITIDGLEKHHDKQRHLANGGGTWNRVISNLLEIKKKYKSSLSSFMIRTNLTRGIHDDFHKYTNFIKCEFGDDKRFSLLLRLAADWGGSISENVKKEFCTKQEYIDDVIYALEQDVNIEFFKNLITPGSLLCYAWKRGSYVIKPNGNIAKCTLRVDDIIGSIEKPDEIVKLDFNKIGSPSKCLACKKYPICLKIDCNLASNSEAFCDYDIEMLDKLLPFIANEKYGCEIFS